MLTEVLQVQQRLRITVAAAPCTSHRGNECNGCNCTRCTSAPSIEMGGVGQSLFDAHWTWHPTSVLVFSCHFQEFDAHPTVQGIESGYWPGELNFRASVISH